MNPTIAEILAQIAVDWQTAPFAQRVQAVSAALGFDPDEEWTDSDGSRYAKWRTTEGVVRLETGGYCIRVGQDYPREPRLLGFIPGHGVAGCARPLKGCWFDTATTAWWLGNGPQVAS